MSDHNPTEPTEPTEPTGLKPFIAEIDIDHLGKEIKRIRQDVQIYLRVRNELILAAQINPDWNVDELATFVFHNCGVSRGFMDNMAILHQDYVRASTQTLNALDLRNELVKPKRPRKPIDPPKPTTPI